ncbi:hypothetical protein [Sediminibacterium sp. C3]|uniref:hypothetical protein n=1 Tax=Sediminibacterium sp. C3 TaxID=1267211 RepID=UPI00047A1FA2|nr:hypothetical protein [Sediminibacterium sp. C3]
MENSELQEQIINLGKFFVQELKLDPGSDTFSKWMAHYIAEKMKLSELAITDEDKKDAEKECFETIIALWKHRWLIPSRKRPLEKFEPILKTLDRLNPEGNEPYFYHSLDHELSELEKNNPDLKVITEYTKMALQIDKAARTLIEFALNQAALKAKNERTQFFLINSLNLHENYDVKIINTILDSAPEIGLKNYNEEDLKKKYLIEKLKNKIEQLDNFAKLNEYIIAEYQKSLSALETHKL